MKRPYRWTSIKKWFPRARIEIAKSVDANSNYVRKENILFEVDNRKGRGSRSDLDDFARKARTTPDLPLFEEFPGHFLRFGQHLRRIRDLDGPGTRDAPDVYWFYGPTGTGKTRKAWELEDLWVAPPGKVQWFDGYHGQKAVLFDDLRPDDLSNAYLLRLLDRYPMRVPVKGGFTNWVPKTIVVTTPKSPEDFWAEQTSEDVQQLRRRITKAVKFTQLSS